VEEAEAELRLLSADRDAALRCADLLVARLDAARRENRRLRDRLDRICRRPVDLEGVEEHLRHVVELAHAEAAEIRAAAQRSLAADRQAEDARRQRHEALEARLRHAEAEHDRLVGQARDEVATLTRAAERRRRELDDRAARTRDRVREDFELAMSVRRAEALRAHAEQEAAARAHAERIVGVAREHVAVLSGQRDRIAAQLREVARTLDEAGVAPALAPVG
jgi:hypothetical protein